MKIKKVYADALTTLAKGTDAGIFRLNPKRVENVDLFIRPDYYRFCIDGNQS